MEDNSITGILSLSVPFVRRFQINYTTISYQYKVLKVICKKRDFYWSTFEFTMDK